MDVLTLILLSVSAVYSDSHSLRYYTVGVSAPGFGIPEFTIAEYVDDKHIELYSSDTRRTEPLAPWLKKNEGPEYWERRTLVDKAAEASFRYEVSIGMKRFNHTRGLHFVQVMKICELRDDGSSEWYKQYSYDGKEFMYFDTQTATFIFTMPEAQIITQRWNSPDVKIREKNKNYMGNVCIDRLKRYIEYGRQDFEQRVPPGVKVTGRESREVTKLHCLVYGFHPRPVDVKWMKNGIDEVPFYESTHVLPNPDGTYQIRVTVEVILKEGESYSCYVDHSSLEKPLLVKWEPTKDSHVAVIICVVVIVLVLTSVTAGVIIYRRRQDNLRVETNEDEML